MRYLLLICLLGGFITVRAQNPDSLVRKNPTDTIRHKTDDPTRRIAPKMKERVYHPDSTHDPHKAWTRSAFVPGWGQLYNHHWWKVPLIYAGLGSLASAIITNQQNYKRFLAIARYQQLGVPASDPMYANDKYRQDYIDYGDRYANNKQAIIDAKDGYYRNKEISILGFLAVWGVNIVDAYIYGKLQHSYSMDNNFGSIQVAPTTLYQPMYASNFNTTFTPALKITLTFK